MLKMLLTLKELLLTALEVYAGRENFSKIRGHLLALWWNYGNLPVSEKELKILSKFVTVGDVCFDIGANKGQYTYLLANHVKERGVVYSFEPVYSTFLGLETLIKASRLDNIKAYNYGLGEFNRIDIITLPKKRWGRVDSGFAHLSCSHAEGDVLLEKVNIITIDDFIKDNNINRLKFIKCDVEGCELFVFKGGEESIKRFKPIIYCEVEDRWTARYGYSPSDLFLFLKELSYYPFVFANDALILTSSVTGNENNYIFIHSDELNDVKTKIKVTNV